MNNNVKIKLLLRNSKNALPKIAGTKGSLALNLRMIREYSKKSQIEIKGIYHVLNPA